MLDRKSVITGVSICWMSLIGSSCSSVSEGSESKETTEEVVEVEEIEVPVEEESEPKPQKPTWKNVSQELNKQLPDYWKKQEERYMFDIAATILRRCENNEIPLEEAIPEIADLAEMVLKLQPAFKRGREGGHMRALRVASDIYLGARESSHLQCIQVGVDGADPEVTKSVPKSNHYILASMAFRESAFLRRTEKGYVMRSNKKVKNCRWCRGTRGEMGMFQFMPKGWLLREFMPTDCSPFDRFCAARTAGKSLAHLRCLCIKEYGSKCNVDSYVAGYGLTSLPEPSRAAGKGGTDSARGHLCYARPEDCNKWWPRE